MRTLIQQGPQRGVIGMEEPIQPVEVAGMVDGIAGDRVAVAGDGDNAGHMLLAVDVADQTADGCLKRAAFEGKSWTIVLVVRL